MFKALLNTQTSNCVFKMLKNPIMCSKCSKIKLCVQNVQKSNYVFKMLKNPIMRSKCSKIQLCVQTVQKSNYVFKMSPFFRVTVNIDVCPSTTSTGKNIKRCLQFKIIVRSFKNNRFVFRFRF